MMSKLKSIAKKVQSLSKSGLEPYEIGKHNFENPSEEIEELAKERLEYCNCLINEPIDFLRVEDKRIPELSNKVCKECFCTAAYKFRQSKSPCPKWKQ